MNRNVTILVTLLLFSCSREIDFNPVNVEQELVVNALIQTGGRDSLLLTSTFISSQSVNYHEGSFRYYGISGANAVVLANGDTVGHYAEAKDKSYHYKGESFEENKEYQLEISHPDYPSVSAKTVVPVVPDFWFGTYAEGSERVKKIDEADIQVLLEFEDDENTNNYYMIAASSTYEYSLIVGFPDERDSIVVDSEPAQLNSKSPIIEMTYSGSSYDFAQLSYDWETYYSVYKTHIVFSDKLFNGQKVSIPVDLSLFEFRSTSRVHLRLTSISAEYYQMLRSLVTLTKNNESFFSEALQMYGNVHNGHGMWAAKSSKQITLDVSGINIYNHE